MKSICLKCTYLTSSGLICLPRALYCDVGIPAYMNLLRKSNEALQPGLNYLTMSMKMLTCIVYTGDILKSFFFLISISVLYLYRLFAPHNE